jgi:tetratricopeptide (TPR) repeat protein
VLFEQARLRDAAALFDSIAAAPGRGELARAPSLEARSRAWQLTHVADARSAAGDTAALAALADSIQRLGALTLSALHERLHLHVRGLLLRARGDDAAAERAFRSAAPGDAAQSPFSRTSLEHARTLLALDRPHDAVYVLRRALTGGLEAANYYTTHSELHELLGAAFHAAGQPDSARAHYAWALRAWSRADPVLHARRAELRERLALLPAAGLP